MEVPCQACPEEIGDPKGLVQCTLCPASFHAACVGVTDLRGFHKKRSSWKCANCASDIPDTEINRKRLRSDSGDCVTIDRNVLSEILESMKYLTRSVDEMKKELFEMRKENKVLVDKLSVVEEKSANKQPGSYAAMLKGQGRNLASAITTPVTRKNSRVVSSPLISVDQVSTAVNKALGTLADNSSKPDEFRVVNPRRNRFRKPVVIGELESQGLSDSSKFEGTERRHWIYVGRVKSGTTTEAISDFVKSKWSIDDVSCIQLAANDDICSFKVGVRESLIPKLLDGSKWPKGVAVREFVFIPKRGGSFGNSGSANFRQNEDRKMDT